MLTMREWTEGKTIIKMMRENVLRNENMTERQKWLAREYLKELEEIGQMEDGDWEITDTTDTEQLDMSRQFWDHRGMGHTPTGGKGYRPPIHRDPVGCPNGVLHVKSANGGLVGAFPLKDDDAWYFRNAMMAYPEGFKTVGDTMIVEIPEEKAKITTTAPGFSSCTFDSCKEYLEAVWGRRLHDSDKRWLIRHPYSEDVGVPQEYTPITASELVKPYNMAVSRIRVKANAFFTGEALQQWQRALGCNPFALLDHQTTNAQAAEKLGITEEEANLMWRFDFDEWPLRPSVLGERQDATASLVAGKRGGHARYLAPRDGNGQWFICYQLLPAAEVVYNEPIVYPEYKAREDSLTLLLYQTKGPDGVTLDDRKWYDRWIAAGMPGKTEAFPSTTIAPDMGNASKAGGSGKGSRAADVEVEVDIDEYDPSDQIDEIIDMADKGTLARAQQGYRLKCMLCEQMRPAIEMVRGAHGVCLKCYGDAWSEFGCPHTKCQMPFKLEVDSIPIIIERTEGQTEGEFRCPGCDQVITAGTDVNLRAIAVNIWGPLPAKSPQSSLELIPDDTLYYGE